MSYCLLHRPSSSTDCSITDRSTTNRFVLSCCVNCLLFYHYYYRYYYCCYCCYCYYYY
ncbi:uncharacterized protein K441DRAFT_660494, partial [Cenococcum geophilum 1.58]|uniref:uncharacterized protein n=1 Tax=Cenococcum geophilum 1.58 TaxID=794803 RepID=UPI00358E65D9